MTQLMNNKVAYIVLALALLVLISFLLLAAVGGIEIADASTLRYCVSSGSVCTGV